jgi:hypothetical protein
MTPDWATILDAFKFSPAIIALLIVIYLLYKLLIKKEESIHKIIKLDEDSEKRNEKIITLLEVLVNRKGQ